MMDRITKIVLTGGPCAGKSTAKSWIMDEYTKLGYQVLFIDESATTLIQSGLVPSLFSDMAAFENTVFRFQKSAEKTFEDAAALLKKKTLIVCDRGVMDIKGYLSQKEFAELLSKNHTNEVHERDGYDAVFHLVTAAKGAEEAYTLDNNAARRESMEEAAEKDDRVINAWTGHPHLRIIDNSTDFKTKMQRLLREISAFLGEPEPMEIERKYLIEFPDLDELDAMPNCDKVSIIQTYLTSSKNGWERRVRQRGKDGNYTYFMTEKHKVTDVTRVETERRLTQKEYLSLLLEADTKAHPIRKDRYCMTYESQYFEIDIYPEWTDQAIMEIELKSEDEEIIFPPHIHVIREVTGDKTYSNYQLAHT